jgi:riboflavin synthase
MGVDFDLSDVAIGASIAHAGCCLTVVSKQAQTYDLDVSNETLALTTLRDWQVGQAVNLERALKVGDELGGHIVSGHVDGVGRLVALSDDGDAKRLVVEVPAPLHRFIAPKGSVAIDGISLTINEVDAQQFGVSIIPHTWDNTTLRGLTLGDAVNIEVDRLARYAARWRQTDPAAQLG